jgi:hypothetical protein
VHGFNGLTEGSLDDPEVREEAFRRARERGFVEETGGAVYPGTVTGECSVRRPVTGCAWPIPS